MEAEVGCVVAAVFGLDRFRVLAAADAGGELRPLCLGCAMLDCGVIAGAKDRRPV